MTTLLRDLAETESPSGHAESLGAVFDQLGHELTRSGLEACRYPGSLSGGCLYARPAGRRKSAPVQLLIGHSDTVWPIGTVQTMPVTETDNVITGPGVFDMKAGLVQIAFALRAVHDLAIDLPATPMVLINSDEEVGSTESTRIITRLAKLAARAFVVEPPLGPLGKLKTSRKGLGRFTLTVRGKAAHAGLEPGSGASAIHELSLQIQKLFAMNDPERGVSVNVGLIEGGLKPNVVAPLGQAVVDVRATSRADADDITSRIHDLRPHLDGVTLEIEGQIGRPPMEKTPRNQALWDQVRDTGKMLGLDLEQAAAGGGSDGNTTSQYTATIDGLGAVGGGAHAADEHVLVDKMMERTALLVLLLQMALHKHHT